MRQTDAAKCGGAPCGRGGPIRPHRRPRRSRRVLVAAWLVGVLSACAGDGRTELLIYSPHGRDMLRAFARAFEERRPDVRVAFLDMGSQEVLDRLRSERARPQADVWWGGPAAMFAHATAEGLLAVHVPEWADGLPADARDPDGHWHGVYITPAVIAYNSAAVAPEDVPRDWDDVLDERWADRLLIRDPLASGTMRTIFGMVLYRSLTETGDTAAGFDWLRRLDAHTKEYVLNPTLLYQKLARQEGLVTLWNMPDIEIIRARAGLPLDYVFPTSGTPLLVDPVAVVAGAPHPELAREFVEFIGGDDAVILAAHEFLRLPARTDLAEDALPEALRRARREIVAEPLDWALLQERTPAWMREWDARVRGRGGRR